MSTLDLLMITNALQKSGLFVLDYIVSFADIRVCKQEFSSSYLIGSNYVSYPRAF